MPLKMSVWGGLPPPIISKISKFLNKIQRGGNHHFSKTFELSNSGGRGEVGPNLDFFSYFHFNASLKLIIHLKSLPSTRVTLLDWIDAVASFETYSYGSLDNWLVGEIGKRETQLNFVFGIGSYSIITIHLFYK